LLSQIARYWRFSLGVRKFLKEKITPQESRQILTQRLKDREQNLLTTVKEAIYANKTSPYLELLNFAGCEYGDFERMVVDDGIEPALRKLCDSGVYITIEEFKGRKEVKRGSKVFRFKESDFDNPLLSVHLKMHSGASRSAGTGTVYDFESLKNYSLRQVILIDFCHLSSIPYAMW